MYIPGFHRHTNADGVQPKTLLAQSAEEVVRVFGVLDWLTVAVCCLETEGEKMHFSEMIEQT